MLVVTGLAAGFINTIAGGGSLLSLPALMITGLPASVANGTNRIAILMAAVAGITGYKQAGKLPARAVLRLLPPTLAGAAERC